jgi:proteasome accessory factor B
VVIDAAYEDAVRERFWHQTQQLTRTRDGRLLLKMRLGRLEEIADWILGMGEHAYVKGPKELRDEVRRRLRAAAGQYR